MAPATSMSREFPLPNSQHSTAHDDQPPPPQYEYNHSSTMTSPNYDAPRDTTAPAIPRRKPVAAAAPAPSSAPSSLDPQKHPYLYQPSRRSQQPWRQRLSRRTWIIVIAVTATLLLALIIGLAIGLTHASAAAQDLPLPSAHGGPYTGDLTYYNAGVGACGVVSGDGDAIVAVSHLIFDAVSVGSNPNDDPLCGKMIRVKRGDVSVDVKVVDRCVGCQARDLDVMEETFAKLADVALGRVTVSWAWLDGVPGAAGGGG